MNNIGVILAVLGLLAGCGRNDRPPDGDVADAGSSLARCGIVPGTWDVAGTVLPISTDPDCEATTSRDSYASLDQMAGVGGACAGPCICSDVPASEPECVATRTVTCDDGSGLVIVAQKESDTTASGYLRFTFSDDLTCEIDIAATWVRP